MRIQTVHKNYAQLLENYQLRLPIDLEIFIPDDDSVRLLSLMMEELDYKKLYEAYSPNGRNPAVPPKILFKILVYAYMNDIWSSRKIEIACKRDINFMWLLQGFKAPDHNTIARFRTGRLEPILDDLFNQFIIKLYENNELELKNLFIDGTKIEANANRYTFVWKKAVNKNEAKMFTKIQACIEDLNLSFMTNFTISKETILSDIKKATDYLEEKRVNDNIRFVHGIGKRKSLLQKFKEELENFYERQEKYNEHNKLFNGRNSYSKTDPDATFMHMKDDHMRNSQLKPGYNVQIGVESEYITGIGVFPDRSDTTTLVPFLNNMESNLDATYKNVIADSGYESEENYLYLEGKKQNYYIKPQTYEKWKKRSFKKDISKRENMVYDQAKDQYTCHNGKRLSPAGVINKTSSTGYRSEITIYECEDCCDCKFKSKCTKAQGNRRMQVSKTFVEKRQISYKNVTSDEGILLRMNRSIQVEGAFGVLKNDYQFNRFLTRGKNNVKTEFILLCFGYNINKLHSKIQNDRLGHTLHKQKTA